MSDGNPSDRVLEFRCVVCDALLDVDPRSWQSRKWFSESDRIETHRLDADDFRAWYCPLHLPDPIP